MSLFSKVRERLRDHTRDELCARLHALGIPAQMAERGRPEEKITSWRGSSKGVIDIASGPIRWVNIKKDTYGGGPVTLTTTGWDAEYGIPDSKIDTNFPVVRIETVLVKDLPVLGKVLNLGWKGNDVSLSVINRLTSDDSLRQLIFDFYELKIETYPKHGCWLLTVKGAPDPSEMHWNCYQTIASHLLAIPKWEIWA